MLSGKSEQKKEVAWQPPWYADPNVKITTSEDAATVPRVAPPHKQPDNKNELGLPTTYGSAMDMVAVLQAELQLMQERCKCPASVLGIQN